MIRLSDRHTKAVQTIQDEHQQYLATRHFGSLDGIRCLAIVAVVWHHAAGTFADWSLPGSVRGYLGVDLFFVLSGYLIATLLLRERDRMGKIDLTAFYARRTLRIFPIYYLTIALTAVYQLVRGGDEGMATFVGDLPLLLTFTTNWTDAQGHLLFHAWSLAVEEQFYLVWPPLLVLLAGLAVRAFLVPFLLLNVLFAMGVFGIAHPPLEVLEVTFAPIAMGVLLAHVMHQPNGYATVSKVTGFAWARPVWLAAVLLPVLFWTGEVTGWPRIVLHVIMVGFVAACVTREDGALARPLQWAPVRRLGLVSYGMYLYHMLALVTANQVVTRFISPDDAKPFRLVLFVVAMLVTWLAAEVSFLVLERPLLKLKDRFKPGFRENKQLQPALV